MPTGADIDAASGVRARPFERLSVSAGAVLFAIAFPVLFVHAQFQPAFAASAGSTQIELRLSDLAVVLIGIAAAIAARREGIAPLRHGRAIWITSALFLLWIGLATFYPLVGNDAYPWRTHLVTAVKYAEYAVLALSVPLLLRTRREMMLLVWSLVAVSAAASAVAVVQFFGVDVFRAWPSGSRQPGFVGVDDLGMLSAAAYAVACGTVVAPAPTRHRRMLGLAAGIGGAVGLIASAALAGVLGALLATAAAGVLARRFSVLDLRRAATLAAMALVVFAGSVFMRSSALASFAHFAGLGHKDNGRAVESYSHRWVLDYVGLKIFVRHPVVGAGWQGGFDESVYGPVLPDAHRRFASQPAQAFPSPEHPWGIQNAYVESLAELGLVGTALFLAWIASGFWVALRTLRRVRRLDPEPFLGVLWLCVVIGVFNGIWFIAGIPFDALIWVSFGLAASPLLVRGGERA